MRPAASATVAPSDLGAALVKLLAAELGPPNVTAPPPAIVFQRNPGHVGMNRRDFLDVLRDMRGDPAFADEVIIRGKLRGASPDAIVRFLRSRPAAPVEASEDARLDAAARAELDLVTAPAPGRRAGGRR